MTAAPLSTCYFFYFDDSAVWMELGFIGRLGCELINDNDDCFLLINDHCRGV